MLMPSAKKLDLVLLLLMLCCATLAPNRAVMSAIAIQGSLLFAVGYAGMAFFLARNIYDLFIGAFVYGLLGAMSLLVPLVIPCVLLSGCLKVAVYFISRITDMQHVSPRVLTSQPRPIRRKEVLRLRRYFKKVFREEAKQYRRLRADYGQLCARLMCSPTARLLLYGSLKLVTMLVITLIQACIVTVAITILRIASSIVIYTIASMLVATTFWTMVALSWFLFTEAWNGGLYCILLNCSVLY